MNAPKQAKGFTIIEVVLVLAIAALIFLMIFIALPALQRGQRDTQRRDDISRFISQLNSYSANNNGKVPTLAIAKKDFLDKYMKRGDGEFTDPRSGANYTVTDGNPVTNDDGASIQYKIGNKCNGEELASAGPRSVAVRVQLEGSGIFCQDNQ